jgi:hypothetical protein
VICHDEARKGNLMRKLINEQRLHGNMNCMLLADTVGCSWQKRCYSWVQEDVEEAFWWFVDQNWKDSLNVASADFIGNRAGLEASLEARQLWYYCTIQCTG